MCVVLSRMSFSSRSLRIAFFELLWTMEDTSADYIEVLCFLFFPGVLHALVLMFLLAEGEQEAIRSLVDLTIFRLRILCS